MILLTGIDTSTGNKIAISTLAVPYDLTGEIHGQPTANQTIVRRICGRVFTLPANLTGSGIYAGTAPTADVTFTVNKTTAGTTTAIGTITIPAGQQIGTFTMASAVTTAVGDLITVVFQNSTDATVADVVLTLVATTVIAV